MADPEALARSQAHIIRLEKVLAEYVLRYGLTDRARTLFREASARATKEGQEAVAGPEERGG